MDLKTKLQQKELRQQKLTIVLLAALFLILSLAIIFLMKYLKKKKDFEIKQAKQKKEEELRRFKGEYLHTYSGNISSACNTLKELNKNKPEFIENIVFIEKQNRNIRDISSELRASSQETYLPDTISSFLNTAHIKNSGIDFVFSPYSDGGWSLPGNTGNTVKRIVQDLINNIILHSEAKNAEISIDYSKSKLNLIIADDGKGLPQDFKTGQGISSVIEKVELLNGKIDFDSSSGTVVMITINF